MKPVICAGLLLLLALAGCSTRESPTAHMNNDHIRLRVATFNVSMEAGNYQLPEEPLDAKALRHHLQTGQHPQIKAVAEILQRLRPDIVLLNEFDYIQPQSEGLDLFQSRYLSESQAGQIPIEYPYRYTAPVNTGVLMPLDHNGDGAITAPEDAFGFGHYPGQYGMALLSRFPIERGAIRTFQRFLWKDMPGAMVPENPDGTPYYSQAVWSVFRLSSKSHWDVPVRVGDDVIHLLASHPTPPVFDGPEDRNGKRNHDEIRFWVDYLNNADYQYDDQGNRGGLSQTTPFVILGDLNASPAEGESRREAIQRLLDHPAVNAITPTSEGGREARPEDVHAASHTVSWGLRADYVLPSVHCSVEDSGIFWPTRESPLRHLVESREASSDHRLVWVDLSCPR